MPIGIKKTSKNIVTQTSNNFDNRVVMNTTNTLDGGAISGAFGFAKNALNSMTTAVYQNGAIAQRSIDAATKQTLGAYDFADGLFSSALDFADTSGSRALDAYDRAAQITESALSKVSKSSETAISQLQGAYADAKGTSDSQKQIMIGVLAVAAVVAIGAFYLKAK